MWKKIGICLIALIAVGSAGYVVNRGELLASEEHITLGTFEYKFGTTNVYYRYGDLVGDNYRAGNAYFLMVNHIGDKVVLKPYTSAANLGTKISNQPAMDNALYEKTEVKKAIDVMNSRLDPYEKSVAIPNDLGEYLRLPTVSDFYDTSITGCELTVPTATTTFPVKCLKYRGDTNVQFKVTDLGVSNNRGWYRDLSPLDNKSYFFIENPASYGLRTIPYGSSVTAAIAPVVEIDTTKVDLVLNVQALQTDSSTKMKVYTKIPSGNQLGIRDNTLTMTTSSNLTKEENGFKFQYEHSRPVDSTVNERFNLTYLLKKKGDSDPNNFAYYGGVQLDADKVTGRIDFDTIVPDAGTYEIYIYTWSRYDNYNARSARISNIVKYDNVRIGMPEFISTPQKDITYYEASYNTLTDDVIGEVKKADTSLTGVNYTFGSHPEHTSDTHANDYTNFKFEESADKTKDIIKASKDMTPGVYYFQIIKLNSDGTQDNTLTIECEITVYPSRDTIKFTPSKKIVDGKEQNYTSDEVNQATMPIILGTTTLDPTASADFGTIKYGFKNAKLNGASVATGNEDFQMDPTTGKITKKDKVSYGKHDFTSTVTFTKGETSITLEKGTHTFSLSPIIYFVDPKTPTTKITKMEVTYDDADTNHNFNVIAKSDDSPVTTAMKYRLKSTDTSKVLSYSGSGGVFQALKPGTTTIEAYYEDGGVDIAVTELEIKVAAKPITNLTYTFTPQKDSANVSYTYLAYQKNATSGTVVGHIASKNGAKPITYKLSDTTNFTLKENNDDATKVDQPYVCDTNGNVLIYANKDLGVGKYDLKIQAYDIMQEPYWSVEGNTTHYGIDKDDNKVDSYPYGRISDNYEIVVYPNEAQVTLTQNKKTDGNYYTNIELNKDTTIKLANVEFASSAMISQLSASGYIIDRVEIVEKGTMSAHSEMMVVADSVDKNKFYIMGKGNLKSGKKEFDLLIKFKKSGSTDILATITKADQSIQIAADLQFANPDQPTEFLSDDSYTKFYDPEDKSNTVTMIATDNALANIANTKVKYCILEGNTCTTTSDIIEVKDDGYGSVKIKALPPKTTKKIANIRAYIEDDDKNVIVSKDISFVVHPAMQNLSWEGNNIQSSGNHIVKDTTLARTWNLNLKYDKDNVEPQNFTMDELIKNESTIDNVITLRDDVIAGTTPLITYDIKFQDIADMDKVVIENGKLQLLGELKGNVIITASAEACGNYMEAGYDDETTTDINEESVAKLIVTVKNKAKVDFVKAYSKDPKASSEEALGKKTLGELKIDPITETGYVFEIGSVKQKDELSSTEENEVFVDIDASKFIVKVESNKSMLYANTNSPLSAGKYLVSVKAKKDKEEATAKEITIVIGSESIDITKLKWQSMITDTYADVKGTIDVDTHKNTETLQTVYAENGMLFVKVQDIEGESQLDNTTIKYALSLDSDTDVIQVDESGQVSMLAASQQDSILEIKATITKEGYDDTLVYVPVLIEKGEPALQLVNKNGTAYTNVNALDKTKYNALELVYEENGLVDVFTKGVPSDTSVSIQILDKGASKGNDVFAFSSTDTTGEICEISKDEYMTNRLSKCSLTIKNALFNQLKDRNKLVYQAHVDESKNFKAMSVEMPINVSPAQQTDFDFAESELFYESNQNALIEPVFQRKDGEHVNISTGKITLLTSINGVEPDFEEDEVWLDDSTYNPDDPIYTDGIKAFGYNIVIAEGEEERVGTVYAQKAKDRNFSVSEIKPLKIHIMPEGTCQYQVTIKNYPTIGANPTREITYGDAYFSLSAKSEIEDESDPDATYRFELDESAKAFLAPYGTNGNEFTPLKAGTKVKIKITRTSGTGIASKPVTKSITIKPRELHLQVNDIQKKNGMRIMKEELSLTASSNDFLAKDKDKLVITYLAQDQNGNDLVELNDGIRMIHNKLPLKAVVSNADEANDVLSNYKLVKKDGKTQGVEDGILHITEDASLASWFTIKEGTNSEGIVTKKGLNNWYNGPLDISIQSIAGSYDLLSEDGTTWKSNKLSYVKEGNQSPSIQFRQASGSEIGAISKPQAITIKIDTTKPEIKAIKASVTHQDIVSKLLRAITFNTYMKPGEKVTIETADVQKQKDIEVSSTNDIPDGITYSVYSIDEEGTRISNILDKQHVTTNKLGVGSFTLEEPGSYEVCATVRDQAGNTSDVSCEQLLVKKIDVDVDGDGKKDFIDSDDDGCPDIDIVLTKTDGSLYKLNVDRNKDKIPDMNIDSDGDGIADINIDSDGDNKPDLNLVILTKWEPSYCVNGQSDRYCTMQNIQPLLNMDLNHDGIPEINIDTKGDFKPHYNVTKPGEKTPYLNIGKVHTTWKPDKDYQKGDFQFDSIAYHPPLVNIDTDDDGLPDINLDIDGDGEPEINVDRNSDLIPDLNIDGNGDGIADFNLDPDENGKPTKNVITITKWTPDKNGESNGLAFDTMSIQNKDNLQDQGVTVEKPGGVFLPNFSIKVENIKDSASEALRNEIGKFVEANREIKDIIDVKLFRGEEQIQPDEPFRIKIPMKNDWRLLNNLKVIAEQADGSFKEIEVVIEGDYIIYESSFLGKVSVIGDILNEEPIPDPKPTPEPTPEPSPTPDVKDDGNPSISDDKISNNNPSTKPTVKGEYYGGAITGDDTNLNGWLSLLGISVLPFLWFQIIRKARKDK